jgi:hypothetical protein
MSWLQKYLTECGLERVKKFYADDIYNADETDLFYCATLIQFPKLQTHNSVSFKESIGSCNIVVQFKHVRNSYTEAVGYWEKG